MHLHYESHSEQLRHLLQNASQGNLAPAESASKLEHLRQPLQTVQRHARISGGC